MTSEQSRKRIAALEVEVRLLRKFIVGLRKTELELLALVPTNLKPHKTDTK